MKSSELSSGDAQRPDVVPWIMTAAVFLMYLIPAVVVFVTG